MARTYYQIEVTARQLTLLLLLLGVAMVAAFVLGYGAAVSTRDHGEERPVLASVATPAPVEEIVHTPVPPAASVAGHGRGAQRPPEAPAAAMEPTSTHVPPTPTRIPTTPARVRPAPAHARPKPVAPSTAETGLWVQVLAVTRSKGIPYERKRLARLGFPKSHQRLLRERRKDGTTLYRLQIGPFPDVDSAQRVRVRMKKKGYRDAWIAPQ